MKRPYGPLLIAFVSLLAGAPGPAVARDASLAKAKYLDPKLPTEKRVADLLARMTLEEKIAQLNGYWFPKSGVLVDDQLRPALGNDKARALLANGLGEISRPSENEDRKKNLGPRQMAELTNALQKYVIEQTRLGIPLLNHEEGLHGLQAPGATSYPQPIALAASFDPALVEEVMTAVARETRARGAQHTLAPVVDVMRDARWGRAEETYGEDPYLVTRMGVAAVRGLQGPPRADRKIDSNHVIATLKHFAVHGQPESGINVGPGNISERVIREVFLPPFVAAIKEAGARALMPAYIEIDGVPAHANKQFLQDILRKEWGFDGLVVSDYFAVEQLKSLHSVVDSDAAAARLALESGVDLELPDPKMYPLLLAQVKSKAIPIALVDKSVARVLRAKFDLGLFEQPYIDVEQADKIAGAPEHMALARKAADRSIVLLKNAGGLLPLDKAKVKTIAVIGPNAEPCRLGGYSGIPKRCIGVLRGIKEAAGSGDQGDVVAGRGDHARFGLVGGQGRDVDARRGPPHDRRRGRRRAQGRRGGAGGRRQRAELARGVGAQPPRRSPQPGSAGPAGRSRARDPGDRQADGRRADQRPPAVDQRDRRAGGRRSWRASISARRAAPRSPPCCSAT